MTSLSDVAYLAADIMAERGHCKRVQEDVEGRVCFRGAIYAALKQLYLSRAYEQDVEEEAARILWERPLRTTSSPVCFNDRSDTSGEDVILLLKETGSRLAGPWLPDGE
jgi:hypothetical protein